MTSSPRRRRRLSSRAFKRAREPCRCAGKCAQRRCQLPVVTERRARAVQAGGKLISQCAERSPTRSEDEPEERRS